MHIVGQHVWSKAYPGHKGIIVEAVAPDNRSQNPIYKIVYDDMPALNGWHNHDELLTTGPKHKHAELMLQYAKESFTDPEAYKQWQFSRDGDTWFRCEQAPVWATSVQYRRKPVSTYKPVKEKIEFVKPVKNVNDLIGVDTLYVTKQTICQFTYAVKSTDINQVEIDQMSPYDINHLINNNAAFTSKEDAQKFIDAYLKMKTYMR